MLLNNRRAALIHVCLAGMQVAWALPLWLLAYRRGPAPWVAYLVLVAGLLGWSLVLELLSRWDVKSPAYDLLALGLMFLAGLLLIRLVLYPGGSPFGFSWFGRAAADVFYYRGGLPPTVALLAVNLFLWQRATVATSRELSFFSIGVSFRLGLLLMLVTGGVYTAYLGPGVLWLPWLYFGLGLVAVALARVIEKANDAQSAGKVLPGPRLLQLLLAVALTLGLAVVLSAVYTGNTLAALLRAFDPVWQLVEPLLLGLLLLIARILNPVFLWFEEFVTRLLGGRPIELNPAAPGQPGAATPPPPSQFPTWPLELLKDVLAVILIVGVVVGALGFLLLYLDRVGRERGRLEDEEEEGERATFGRGILGRGLDSMRNAARLLRRYRGRQLLAAISVENMYANLCRIARWHGFGRPAALPPDQYLRTLARAFPEQDERLARITAAYMQVHYGDHPIASGALAGLRQDYRAVREAELPREVARRRPA